MAEDEKEWPPKESRVDEIVMPWRKFINERPPLLSLLYDIDMLPEQCVTNAGAIRLSALCDVWKAWEAGEKCPTWKEPAAPSR